MKHPRTGKRIEIGPNAVDYNGLMKLLEDEERTLLLLVPRYGIFGNLKGFFAFVSFTAWENRVLSKAGRKRS